MLVTLSERKLSEQIRQLEGLDASTTIEEITDRMPHYAGRLFQHLSRDYGVTMTGMVGTSGRDSQMGTFQFALKPIYDEESRGHRLQGLAMMNPNSVTVEQGDLPGLVPNGMVQTMLDDEWDWYSAQLQKVLPSDIPQILETAAQHAMNRPSSNQIGIPEYDEEMYQDFLRRSGKADPLKDYEARDKAQQEELQRIEAAKDAEYVRLRFGSND